MIREREQSMMYAYKNRERKRSNIGGASIVRGFEPLGAWACFYFYRIIDVMGQIQGDALKRNLYDTHLLTCV